MEPGFDEAERQFTGLVEKYKAPSSQWLEAVEAELGPDGRKVICAVMQGHINTRGNGDIGPSLSTASGAVLTHRRLIKRSLQTMFTIGYSWLFLCAKCRLIH